jgi:hypothetical protein
MKILYFHGLESALPSSKSDWMAERGHTVVSHPMRYKQKNSYGLALKYAKAFEPDMIVGSSMGGYFAFRIGTHIPTTLILLNPALVKRSEEYNCQKNGVFKPKIWALLGKNDEVVNSIETTKILEEFNAIITTDEHAHRTPLKVFQNFINEHQLLAI